MHTATRYHDFSAGHRVVGHENKCADLHGHNYRVHFHCRAKELDSVGRVVDFGVIKSTLCNWVETYWDHRFLVWKEDTHFTFKHAATLPGLEFVPFNPTAENMAEYLVKNIGPRLLKGTGVELYKCVVEETRKCSATYELGGD